MNVLTSLAQYRLATLQNLRERQRGQQGLMLLDVLIAMAIFSLILVIAVTTMSKMKQRALEANGGKPLEKPVVTEPVTSPTATSEGTSFPWGVLFGVVAIIAVVIALGFGLYLLTRHMKTLKAQRATLDGRWDTAYKKFDAVRLDWGTLNSDPLAILEHSRLLDVSFEPTSRFMDSFHILQDRMNVSKTARELSPTELQEVEAMTTEVQRLWANARTAAERASYTWLPEDQRGHASLAAKMLRLAANEGAEPGERANAAERAAALLRKIDSFHFPKMTMEAIEGNTRLMIEAPQRELAL